YGGGVPDPDRKLAGAYYTPAGLVARALDGLPRPQPGAQVADLACGEGVWLAAAEARWPDAQLHGIDLDADRVRRASAQLPRAHLQIGDGLSASLPELDLVVGNPPWGAGRSG